MLEKGSMCCKIGGADIAHCYIYEYVVCMAVLNVHHVHMTMPFSE